MRAVAKGLVAAGVEAGDRVALLSKTRYEWTLFDYAIWFAGAVTVPIYETSSAEQIGWILAGLRRPRGRRRGPTAPRAGRARFASPDLAELRHVWSIEDNAVDVLAPPRRGHLRRGPRGSGVRRRPRSTWPRLIYTSGTTGRPKGCMLTHGNFMFELGVAVDELHELFDAEGASTLLFLPLAHVFARIIQVGAVKSRRRLGHSADIKNLRRRPRRVPADVHPGRAPRLREGLQHRLPAGDRRRPREDLRPRGRRRDRLVARARRHAAVPVAPARPARALRQAGLRQAPAGARRLAARTPSRAARPLGDRLGHFYRGIGLTVLEGYGLTETTAALTVNLPDAQQDRHRGPPAARASSVRVADDGELLFKGGQVFAGYWGNEAATARRSTATAGSTPATSARSTTRASSGSPGARRRSW